MDIRFWGTRGSFAKPGRSTLRHGGNTSCVEVRGDDGTRRRVEVTAYPLFGHTDDMHGVLTVFWEAKS